MTTGGSVTVSNKETRPILYNEVPRQIQQGHLNCVVQGTLTANVGSTTFRAPTCNSNSAILPSPVTAHAAAEIAAGTMYFTRAHGQFTVNHANNAQVDRTFVFVVIG